MSAARNKLVRAGRRWGKSRLAFHVAVVGHGAGPGISGGKTVVWLAPDYPQATTIWREEVQPRFRPVEGVRVNESEHTAILPNGGTLAVRSAEAIEGIRGMGKQLSGIIVDEAAHQDLEYALRNVLRPALLDNEGWLLLVSTPYAGSHFNVLCEQVMAGERGTDWQHWHGTPYDNPKLNPLEIKSLIGEYPADSPELRQEVFAELLTGGAGLAFPEWRTDLHVSRHEPQPYAEWWAGLDWGYTAPGCIALFASDGERMQVRYEYKFKQSTPYDVGHSFGLRAQEWPLRLPQFIAADPACWAVTDGGPSIAEELQRGLRDACPVGCPALLSAPRGAGSRVSGKMLVHQALRYEAQPDGTVPAWARPRLTIHPSCTYLVSSLPKLPRDERKPEDVDTTSDDHGYDALRYGLMAREPQTEKPQLDAPEDRHPGFTATGKRRARDRTDDVVIREELEDLAALGQVPGGRYGYRGIV